jgi:hypothetical protein
MEELKAKDFLSVSSPEECGCCQLESEPRDGEEEVYGCAERSTVFTRREQRVLRQIREASRQARTIKKNLEALSSAGPQDSERRADAALELERLRAFRAELEMERIAAADERMRLLGHL